MVCSEIRKHHWLQYLMLLWAGFLTLTWASVTEAADFSERVKSMAEVNSVRVSNSSDKTRIVLDLGKEATFTTKVLSNPQRIVVDIDNAWLNPKIDKSIKVSSRFAKNIRVAQFDTDTVRVVVESTLGKNNIKVFPLKGGNSPYRLVLDFGNLSTGSSGAGIDWNPQPKDTSEEVLTKPTTTESTKSPEKVQETDKVLKEPVFMPGIKGKVIALDAGHGGSDVGAIGPTGVTEKSVTLRIALELQKLLQQAGAKVLMTRTTDTEVSPKKYNATDIEELQARCDVANRGNADIFVSIHMDSFTNSTPAGTTGYYYGSGTKTGQKLSQLVSENVSKALSTGNRGNKSCNFYVVKHTEMPATLVEIAFISNQKEERLLNSAAGIKTAAQGVFQGIEALFQ